MSKKKNSDPQEELILGQNRQARIQQDDEVERAREFWDNNKSGIIGGVVLGLAVVLGYNYWQSYKLEQGQQASLAYEELTTELTEGHPFDKQMQLADEMLSTHTGTVYHALAAMQIAKNAVDAGEFESAEKYLNEALENTDDDALAGIIRVRLAQVLLQLEKNDELISMLESQPESGFTVQYQELIGDAYVAKEDFEKAKQAYNKGIEIVTENGSQPGVLQFKLDALN